MIPECAFVTLEGEELPHETWLEIFVQDLGHDFINGLPTLRTQNQMKSEVVQTTDARALCFTTKWTSQIMPVKGVWDFIYVLVSIKPIFCRLQNSLGQSFV